MGYAPRCFASLAQPMQYPEIDPIIFTILGLPVRWYGMTYLAGFLVVYLLGNYRAKHPPAGVRTEAWQWDKDAIGDLVFYGALGAVIGGRVGYVLFYNFGAFLDDPLYLFRTWEGGMSFHGGLLGVIVAMVLFARKSQRSIISVTDFLAPLTPIGLGFGRLGNFINMELPGRVSEGGFGLIYKCHSVQALNPMCVGEWEGVTRHPSSLYQAFTEGLLLFLILWFISAKARRPGFVTGCFFIGYGAFRFCTEFFRSPDAHIGFIAFDWLSMGQLLSIPMVIIGILLLAYGDRLKTTA